MDAWCAERAPTSADGDLAVFEVSLHQASRHADGRSQAHPRGVAPGSRGPPGSQPVSSTRSSADERAPHIKSGCAPVSGGSRLGRMAPRITRINPDQLHTPPGYHHITVVESGRTAFLAGQCPLDVSGTLVGAGDIDVQIDQVVSNSAIALAAVGAQPARSSAPWSMWSATTPQCWPPPGVGSPARSSRRRSPPRAPSSALRS